MRVLLVRLSQHGATGLLQTGVIESFTDRDPSETMA